jgi:hypothetical protein
MEVRGPKCRQDACGPISLEIAGQDTYLKKGIFNQYRRFLKCEEEKAAHRLLSYFLGA